MRCLVALALLLAACVSTVHAVPVVRVLDDQGASHHGVVDARTDELLLWLRQDQEHASLATSVLWSSIVLAKVDDEEVNVADLRQRIPKLKSLRASLDVLLGPVDIRPYQQRRIYTRNREAAAAISIRACLANWDRDAQPDGIELQLMVYDRFGSTISARGDMSITLTGRRLTSRHRSEVATLARWSEPVAVSHFGKSGNAARYRLPFRGFDPEGQLGIGDEAVIDVSLGVSGQGRFATRAPLLLRELPLIEDRLERQTGRLAFPLP